MTSANVLPGPPLRIAVLGDFESLHTQRYVRFFAERGHEMHAISFYAPSQPLQKARYHVLAGAPVVPSSAPVSGESLQSRLQSKSPASLLRLVHAWRYQRAGLKRVLAEMRPDVFHAHYIVEHGFYARDDEYSSLRRYGLGIRPAAGVIHAAGPPIAAWTLRHADAVTGNDPSLLTRARELGVSADRTTLVRVGIDRLFLEAQPVNLDEGSETPPTLISDRALEPLYNVETVVRVFARLRGLLPDVASGHRGRWQPAILTREASARFGYCRCRAIHGASGARGTAR